MRAETGTLCRLSPCHCHHQRAASGWRVFEVRLKQFIKRLNLDWAWKAICFEIEIDFLGPWNLAIPRRWSSLKNSPAFKPCTARDNPMQSNAIHCRWIVICSPHLENAIRVGIGDELHHPCMLPAGSRLSQQAWWDAEVLALRWTACQVLIWPQGLLMHSPCGACGCTTITEVVT